MTAEETEITAVAMMEAAARVRALERAVASAHNRDTISKALYEALLDGLEFGPRDLPSPDDREWLRGAVARPLQEATEAALFSLVWNIEMTLEEAPARIREHFDASHAGQELGWE